MTDEAPKSGGEELEALGLGAAGTNVRTAISFPPTYSNIQLIPIESIGIPPNRQRGNKLNGSGEGERISDPEISYGEVGFFGSILITQHNPPEGFDFRLVCGRRRLEAASGDDIPAQIITPHPGDPSPETMLESLELYEDYKRLNRDPINLMNSRARVAKLLAAKGLTQDEIGKRLGLKKQSVSETKSNSEFALAHPEEVEKCETEYDVKKARLKWQDKEAARHRWALQEITGVSFEIIHADFHEWAPRYRGPRFNLGHFDFPYGIGQDQFNQSSRTDARYDDSPEAFERLCDTLERYMDQIFDEDAPSIFWFPIKRIYEVRQRLERMPWQVNPHPLVWVKPTAGIIPVPDRTPRQCVEYAFLCSRGNRRIESKRNWEEGDPPRDRIHQSQKNEAVVEHFLSMLVTPTTRILDPTCGSGVAIRVAKRLGAEAGLGLELDRDFVLLAQDALAKEPGK
jgi:transcriptional regulator with XRE-family HTH domain